MKKLLVITTVLALGVLFIFPVSGCGTAPSTTATTTQPQPTSTLPPGQEPVEIVSVVGPIPPINPGGPTIEITLKNVSAENIVSLKAIIGIGGAGPGLPPTYFFNVSSTAPLEPGKTVSSKLNIIGGGFSSDQYYPLSINGTLQIGKTFGYTVQVKITSVQ
jgi:hypothetical protein